jgi:hypothetical protein
MMAEMAGLSPDGLSAMAIRAPNLALADLRPKRRDGVLLECEPDDSAAPLRSGVVEFQDHHVAFRTADAGGAAKMIKDELEVAPLDGPMSRNV